MCNIQCEETTPCCLCKWNWAPYKCKEYKCGEKADFCQQEIAEQNLIRQQEAMYQPPEPPYNYVEILEVE